MAGALPGVRRLLRVFGRLAALRARDAGTLRGDPAANTSTMRAARCAARATAASRSPAKSASRPRARSMRCGPKCAARASRAMIPARSRGAPRPCGAHAGRACNALMRRVRGRESPERYAPCAVEKSCSEQCSPAKNSRPSTGCGECRARGVRARRAIRIGAERIRIARPGGLGDRREALAHVVAERGADLLDRERRDLRLRASARTRRRNSPRSPAGRTGAACSCRFRSW